MRRTGEGCCDWLMEGESERQEGTAVRATLATMHLQCEQEPDKSILSSCARTPLVPVSRLVQLLIHPRINFPSSLLHDAAISSTVRHPISFTERRFPFPCFFRSPIYLHVIDTLFFQRTYNFQFINISVPARHTASVLLKSERNNDVSS